MLLSSLETKGSVSRKGQIPSTALLLLGRLMLD